MPRKSKTKEANRFFVIILFTLLVILLALANVSLFYSNIAQDNVLGASETIPEELTYLEGFLEKEPLYLPGWVEKARIEKELGLTGKYNESVKRIIHIDPNYEFNF